MPESRNQDFDNLTPKPTHNRHNTRAARPNVFFSASHVSPLTGLPNEAGDLMRAGKIQEAGQAIAKHMQAMAGLRGGGQGKKRRRSTSAASPVSLHVPGYGPGTRPNPNAGKVCIRGFAGCGQTAGTYDPATQNQMGRKSHSTMCMAEWKASGAAAAQAKRSCPRMTALEIAELKQSLRGPAALHGGG